MACSMNGSSDMLNMLEQLSERWAEQDTDGSRDSCCSSPGSISWHSRFTSPSDFHSAGAHPALEQPSGARVPSGNGLPGINLDQIIQGSLQLSMNNQLSVSVHGPAAISTPAQRVLNLDLLDGGSGAAACSTLCMGDYTGHDGVAKPPPPAGQGTFVQASSAATAAQQPQQRQAMPSPNTPRNLRMHMWMQHMEATRGINTSGTPPRNAIAADLVLDLPQPAFVLMGLL